MKIVYTEDALNDLDAIADWLIVHYSAVAPAIAGAWPILRDAAQERGSSG
jgi:plasmid stabilization system protein ParE